MLRCLGSFFSSGVFSGATMPGKSRSSFSLGAAKLIDLLISKSQKSIYGILGCLG